MRCCKCGLVWSINFALHAEPVKLWHDNDLIDVRQYLRQPRIFFPSDHCPETATNTHVSTYFRWSLGASVISTYIRTEGFYVKTAIIHQLTGLCVPDCAYTESMFIYFIHISLYDISLMQNILYQIKRDMAVWKRLGCPQRKQRTWWQIVATPYTGSACVTNFPLFQARHRKGHWQPRSSAHTCTNHKLIMTMSTAACCQGIIVSDRAFLCQTRHLCVEPGILLWNFFFLSNKCYNVQPLVVMCCFAFRVKSGYVGKHVKHVLLLWYIIRLNCTGKFEQALQHECNFFSITMRAN